MAVPSMPNDYPAGSLEGQDRPRTSRALLDDLDAAGIVYDASLMTAAAHGRDWWPLSIREVNEGRVPHWPGVVVLPTTTDEVSRVVRIAGAHQIPVTAQGGRSGVVGGAVAPDGAIALDLTGLDRIISLDDVAGTVRVDAGCFGPDLERHVREHGWTVGHFPQSFDLATVGGWIACRGAGQYSNRYGAIEDLVRSLRVVLASGEVIDVGTCAPRQAVGPNLVELFVGSEGTLGVVTEATLVLQRVPAFELRAAYGFDTFAEGLETCRRIMQRGARPAVLRLYDATESQRHFDQLRHALIVLDEGDPSLVAATIAVVAEECRDATSLDDELVARWLTHRNDVSALAPLWAQGVVVDTIEVAGAWSVLEEMRERVSAALGALEGTVMVSVHQSHAYLDGACLYFTFAGLPTHDTTQYYRHAWDVASRSVLALGGALSHHHGVGRNRARFVPEALGSAYGLLVELKRMLDPLNILNPGALGVGGPPW